MTGRERILLTLEHARLTKAVEAAEAEIRKLDRELAAERHDTAATTHDDRSLEREQDRAG